MLLTRFSPLGCAACLRVVLRSAVGANRHSLQSLLSLPLPSDAMLETLQKHTSEHRRHAVEKRLLATRAYWLSYTLPGDFSDPPAGYFDRRISPAETFVTALTKPARDRATTADLAQFEETIEAARQPWPAKLEAADVVSRKYSMSTAPLVRSGFLSVLTSTFGRFAADWASVDGCERGRSTAEARASVGALARANLTRAGGAPPDLQRLFPLSARAAIDPTTAAADIQTDGPGTSVLRRITAGRRRSVVPQIDLQ